METTQARTVCKQEKFEFQGLGRRSVEADFSGGYLSSDGGGLLLREIGERTGLLARMEGCFTDLREPVLVEHPLRQLLAQRVFGLAQGYEDLNDHDRLRHDPLAALVCGREDVLGRDRLHPDDRGKALAGKSTLNRLELSANGTDDATRKIAHDPGKMRALLIEEGVRRIPRRSDVVVIDLDATDDPLHGGQEGRFFHGYYGHYCYLPLYAFCGDIPLLAQLRTSDIDGAAGSLAAVQEIVGGVRRRLGRKVRIIVRADSGF